MGTGGHGGRGAGGIGPAGIGGADIRTGDCSGASWGVHALAPAAPPSERDSDPSGMVPGRFTSGSPRSGCVHCSCRSEAEGMRSLGLGMGSLGLALRSSPSCDC